MSPQASYRHRSRWDNHTDAAGIVHFRPLLQDQVQLLQFRVRCFLACSVRKIRWLRVCAEIEQAAQTADQMGGLLDRAVDTIYFGGGTPTLLDVTQLERIFVTIRQNFSVPAGAEITVECAPGTLTSSGLEGSQRCGVNRVSLGVQSFDDTRVGFGRAGTQAIDGD